MALLLAGIASGRVGEALWLILLFSLGLAAALVAIGLAVVTASNFAARFLDAKRFARKIAIASAGLITVIGIGTIFTSVRHIISVLS
jgi:nickel/cobalt exporter